MMKRTIIIAIEVTGPLAPVGEATRRMAEDAHFPGLVAAAFVGVTGTPPENVKAHRVHALEPDDEEIES